MKLVEFLKIASLMKLENYRAISETSESSNGGNNGDDSAMVL